MGNWLPAPEKQNCIYTAAEVWDHAWITLTTKSVVEIEIINLQEINLEVCFFLPTHQAKNPLQQLPLLDTNIWLNSLQKTEANTASNYTTTVHSLQSHAWGSVADLHCLHKSLNFYSLWTENAVGGLLNLQVLHLSSSTSLQPCYWLYLLVNLPFDFVTHV